MGSFTSAWLALGLSRVEIPCYGDSAPGRVRRVVLLAPDFVDTWSPGAVQCDALVFQNRTVWDGFLGVSLSILLTFLSLSRRGRVLPCGAGRGK